MRKTIDNLLIRLCENLPLDDTLFGETGICEKPNEKCNYCRLKGDDNYLCYKKTYIFRKEPRRLI